MRQKYYQNGLNTNQQCWITNTVQMYDANENQSTWGRDYCNKNEYIKKT